MCKKLLEIKDLHVNAGTKEILKGINLTINRGEINVIMGPNGSGKSTTANAIFNNPEYSKESGKIIFDGNDITNEKTDEIARMGVFMSFQAPEEIPGVSVTNFLNSSLFLNNCTAPVITNVNPDRLLSVVVLSFLKCSSFTRSLISQFSHQL